jgi:hypothetical protein
VKILAISVKTKVLLTIGGTGPFLLERKKQGEDWKVLTDDGYVTPPMEEEVQPLPPEQEEENTDIEQENEALPEVPADGQDEQGDILDADIPGDTEDTPTDEIPPEDTLPVGKEVFEGDVVDSDVTDGLYQYRISKYPVKTENTDVATEKEKEYQYTSWVICGTTGPIGHTFYNYEPAEGEWGDVVTPDDIRFTYMWGTDLKAANGQSYTDEQIRYFINASMEAIGRELEITLTRKKVKSNAKGRGLKKRVDYDVNEDFYRFSYDKIARYGMITTKLRPIINVERVALVGRLGMNYDLHDYVVDYEKGAIKLLKRPIKPSFTSRALAQSIGPYGAESYTAYMFYEIDYEAGYETALDVPADLREIVAKHAAVSMLNVVGDGLMSGFSSSSLSMDGMSESFSSTQSATSAYFGARIKEYKDDIANYIKNNKRKFNNLPMGSI